MKLSSNGLVDSEKTIVLIYSWDSNMSVHG